jgi:hypothetical protein
MKQFALTMMAVLVAGAVGSASAAPISTYTEHFDGATSSGDAELAVAGWNAHANVAEGGSAIAVSLTTAPSDYKAGLGYDDPESIAYFWPGDGPANGGGELDDGILWTDEQTLDRTSPGEIDSFAFDVNTNASGDTAYHPAIQIGSAWYVMKTGASATDDKTWESKSLSFSTAAADWANLDFTPDSVLAIGSDLTSDLPSGEIVAFGLYLDMNTSGSGSMQHGTMRVDNFTVNQVPEPATMSLLAIGGLGVLIRRRK